MSDEGAVGILPGWLRTVLRIRRQSDVDEMQEEGASVKTIGTASTNQQISIHPMQGRLNRRHSLPEEDTTEPHTRIATPADSVKEKIQDT
ncbi:hypothetical protein GGI22_006216, partial [Coemansia erecta]